MITRSKRDSTYEYFELPNKRIKKVFKEEEKRPIYDVDIDFDEAHREWIKNKVKLPNGEYRYKRERDQTEK